MRDPWLIAGGGSGIALGRHLAMPKGTPLCNVWLTLLRGTGCDIASFGDATDIDSEIRQG